MSKQPKVETSPVSADSIAKTTCYMCACRCGINVHIKNGEIRYIEGNRDHPVNQGVALRQGFCGDHAASFPGTSARAAETCRPTWVW